MIPESWHVLRLIFFFSFLILLLFCARGFNSFKIIHNFGMFDRALSPPLHVFFWVNISEFPYSSSVAQIWIFDLGEMFHNVIIKNFALLVLLVVLLNSELYYNFFFFSVIYSFYRYWKAVPLHDKITSKLVLLNFLFDLFGYLLNFLTMFDIYRMLMNYTLRFVLLMLFIAYFISAQECTGSLSFRDVGYSFTILWVSRNFQ